MADGRLFLAGAAGGIASVDGFSGLAIWTPSTNDFQKVPVCVDRAAIVALTADRTRVLMTSFSSSSGFCLYDPATGNATSTTVNSYYDFSSQILIPPNSDTVLVNDGHEFNFFKLPALQLLDRFEVSGKGILSPDGNTLYVYNTQKLTAYDWRNKTQTATLTPVPYSFDFIPGAVSSTTLAGQDTLGISFTDIRPPGVTVSSTQLSVSPISGSPGGGDMAKLMLSSMPTSVLFGTTAATGLTSTSPGNITVTSPQGTGVVDVTALSGTSGAGFLAEGFSYGPNVAQMATNYVTSEGGGTLQVAGFGFAPVSDPTTLPGDLMTTVSSQNAKVVSLHRVDGMPMTMTRLTATLPALQPNTTAEVKITTSSGSIASSTKVLPAAVTVPLPGSVLGQGVYDAKRDLYYFTDASLIQVFLRTNAAWQTAITPPGSTANRRFFGIALSPDNSHLAFTDAGTNSIWTMTVGDPSTLKQFSTRFGIDTPGTQPIGIAINNGGDTVYYITRQVDGTGSGGLRKLKTATGTITSYGSMLSDADIRGAARLLLSPDGARLFGNIDGVLFTVDTATDVPAYASLDQGDYELALSANATTMTAAGFVTDTDGNLLNYLTQDSLSAGVTPILGEKLSPDGSLLFAPTTDGLDMFDAATGIWAGHVATSLTLAKTYDALVSDGMSNVLVAILDAGGVGILDLSSVPLPAPRPAPLLHSTHASAWQVEPPARGQRPVAATLHRRPQVRPAVPLVLLP